MLLFLYNNPECGTTGKKIIFAYASEEAATYIERFGW